MLTFLGRLAAEHARWVLTATLVLLIGAGVLGSTAFDKLQTQGFTDPDSESSQAAALVNSRFGERADLVFLVEADSGTVHSPPVAAAGRALTRALRGDPTIAGVTSYWQHNAPGMRSEHGRYALITAHTSANADTEAAVAKQLARRYGGDHGPISVTLGGRAAVQHDISQQIAHDLLIAESIAVPLILLLLVVVFGSVVAALLPLAIGGVAILGTFAELSVLGSVTDVSIYAINLTTALGLGLAIDYALLSVSRFREQLAAGDDVRAAVQHTVRSAGRTILFSAATVAVALGALLLFPLYFLRSFAYAGIGVVVISALGALLILPALLSVLGHRVNAGALPWARRSPSTVSGFWARVAGAVVRKPAVAAVPVLILLVAAVPLLGVRFGTPDERVLPQSASSRVVGDTLRAHFPAERPNIQVVTTDGLSPAATVHYATELSTIDGVRTVVSSAGVFTDGTRQAPATASTALRRPNAERFAVTTRQPAHSPAAQHVVRLVRDTAPTSGVDTKVGGPTAVLVDSKAAIGQRLPLAFGLIALSTFVLLFLFTGSVVQPLRALLFNLLGLSATLGVLVLVFQEGLLAGLLGFTPLPLDTSMLMLLFCIIFGLSMDYEVFVLSRIKEARDQGLDNSTAVVHGLSRTGRIVTTAAALLAISFFAFGTSGVSFIQMFGIGGGLAVLVDATLIRGLLVPAGIRLTGQWAWWAPKPLRRLHNRIGLSEHPAPAPRHPQPSSV